MRSGLYPDHKLRNFSREDICDFDCLHSRCGRWEPFCCTIGNAIMYSATIRSTDEKHFVGKALSPADVVTTVAVKEPPPHYLNYPGTTCLSPFMMKCKKCRVLWMGTSGLGIESTRLHENSCLTKKLPNNMKNTSPNFTVSGPDLSSCMGSSAVGRGLDCLAPPTTRFSSWRYSCRDVFAIPSHLSLIHI